MEQDEKNERQIHLPYSIDDEAKAVRRRGNPDALRKARHSSRHTLDVQRQARLRVLGELHRYRYMRVIDVAFACYSTRTFTAAKAAAARVMAGLEADSMVARHVSRDGIHIYGLRQRGVAYLFEHAGAQAVASNRSLRDIRHPEHRLFSNLVVMTALARGLEGMTEREVLQHEYRVGDKTYDVNGQVVRCTPQKFLKVRRPSVDTGQPEFTQFTPDALLFDGEACTWVEIDWSKRSPERERDLMLLVRQVGTKLSSGNLLERVVIFASTVRLLNRLRALLRGALAPVPERGVTHLSPCDSHADVYRLMYRDLEGRDIIQGHVQLQLLPKVNSGGGWYDKNMFPFFNAHGWNRPTAL